MILITTESSVRPKANILKPSDAPSYGYEMEIIVLLKGANILQLILTLAKFVIKYIKLHHAECTFIFILWFAIRCGGGYVPYLLNGTILFLELNIRFNYRINVRLSLIKIHEALPNLDIIEFYVWMQR